MYSCCCSLIYNCIPEIMVKLNEIHKVFAALPLSLSLSLPVHEPFCRKLVQELKHKS